MGKKEERVRRKNERQGGAENNLSELTKELGYYDPLWKWLIGSDRLENLGFVPTFPHPIANHTVEVVELFLQLDSETLRSLLISPPKRLRRVHRKSSACARLYLSVLMEPLTFRRYFVVK